MGFTQARQGISYDSLEKRQKQLIPIFADTPGITTQIQIIGNPLSNQGMAIAILEDPSKRKSLDEIMAGLWGPANSIPGLETYLVNPPMIPIGGKQAKGDYMFTLLSPDADTLYKAAQDFETVLRKDSMFTGVNSDLQISTPQAEIDIDRDMASSLNVSANDIEQALYTAYGERQISTIYTTVDEYKVIMQLKPEFQKNADALTMLYIRSDVSGQLVRLDALGKIRETTGPVTVNHTGTAPVRHLLLQRQTRHLHGRNHPGRGQTGPGKPPGHGLHHLRRHGGRVRRIHELALLPAFHRHRRHLHPARLPVRVLHPPPDHPVRAALSRLRRTAHPARVRLRPRPLRHGRHHHAHRHRQKELHHGRGLCPRS